ncbi:MAG: VacJ family lipoprotein [Deltaproteobacteria bacterium]|nr:VacJ family lipoprotein [Deltaproteobacteria bacterium]
MKTSLFSVFLILFSVVGSAHGSEGPVFPAPPETALQIQQVPADSVPAPAPPSEIQGKAETESADEYGDIEITAPEKTAEGAATAIADPLEPFNRAMYQFNDKLYFWLLKPVAQGYGKAVPETARIGVGNFFTNLAFPIRFVNCLLQGNFTGAAEELGRFSINTLWGVGGFLDPAASPEIQLFKQEEDFGQTLGSYGLGQGFFINWPFFGPSSPRDTVGLVGDAFLSPTTYLSPWYVGAGTKGFDRVNDTSLTIGNYEALKEAAIDPYVALRDAYVQYRLKKVNRKGGNGPAADPDDREK